MSVEVQYPPLCSSEAMQGNSGQFSSLSTERVILVHKRLERHS
jgi:hypothetical protein